MVRIVSKLDQEPPVARVVRGGGSRFRAIAKYRARLVGRGLGTLIWIGLVVGLVVGTIWLVSNLRSGLVSEQHHDDPAHDLVEQLSRQPLHWHVTAKDPNVQTLETDTGSDGDSAR